jgi:drug/metabolite transporter (DMT)-like permease
MIGKAILNHLCLFSSILLASSSTLLMKSHMGKQPPIPAGIIEKISYVFKLLINPWICLAFILSGLGFVFWMISLKLFPLRYAYPFTSLAYVIVMFGGVLFFNETINFKQWCGVVLLIIALNLIYN